MHSKKKRHSCTPKTKYRNLRNEEFVNMAHPKKKKNRTINHTLKKKSGSSNFWEILKIKNLLGHGVLKRRDGVLASPNGVHDGPAGGWVPIVGNH
jgi:hypothetical protein